MCLQRYYCVHVGTCCARVSLCLCSSWIWSGGDEDVVEVVLFVVDVWVGVGCVVVVGFNKSAA